MKYWPVLLLSLLPLWAQALEEGERLAPWTLLDQFDQPFTLDNQTQTLLVARSMDAAKLVAAALQDQPKGYLEARHAVFVADIQRMPRLIAKMFAVPAMRDYPYRVLLDRDGRVAPRYPGPVDKVLWLQLKDGQLVGQYEFATAAQLREALEKALP
ncbi:MULTISPECIES: FAD/FMN-containing dehydrogenase [unclassified Pseudomonas]|uniref:FAD/FMN-containing dehydrogenase n=1 Tax=unclassified Pseudomonas TaxID=196821 RepID=UPI000C87D38D|nr:MULTISPECIES: FAD/FMN-containing dehydrogenase [unclassified Pseudomonas]PMU08170.1 FAD/FMN-containing dehydrogenase [Pseudomonas sp. FW305-20]PMU15812.1 FAD/FMN-containing dehydrogenase [Pseudomonas sp. FW305-122]PMU39876.1 FAD/FMN-containing dehydrogenase [Pseudomonas sp. FW305-47B]PMX57584.1 FAD/FMN-containing dehydrogenase [Pseudomonas sp. FW305-33]PMX64340.1 FAD/FMN-containing dehydrogenase [Pseudomonas sp. FW305-60]